MTLIIIRVHNRSQIQQKVQLYSNISIITWLGSAYGQTCYNGINVSKLQAITTMNLNISCKPDLLIDANSYNVVAIGYH